jgi:hypothetical protein
LSDELIFPETGMTARDEVRVSEFGLLRCPSCGELAAEVLGRGHCLILSWGDTAISTETWMGYPVVLAAKGKPWCECRDGKRVSLDMAAADYETICAAANISLADSVWFAETQAFKAMGWPA